jgi:HSP20 family protein
MVETTKTVPIKSAPAAEAPVKGSSYPLVSLRKEIDRLFDDFAMSWSGWPFGRRMLEDWPLRMPEMDIGVPAVDFTETDQGYKVTAELPGMDDKDIEVSVSDDVLTIKGEKRQDKEEAKKGYRLSERRYGMFERSFGLPPGVDASKIAAEFTKGVLSVTLPKTVEAQKKHPRKIAVKAA